MGEGSGTVSLAATATDWMDQWFDPDVGLLRNPPGSFDAEGVPPLSLHLVQQGGWYVAGLIRPLGAQRTARGVFIYYPHCCARGYWFLPGGAAASGMAVDGMGRVYVTQGRRVLRHAPFHSRHA